MERTVVIYKSKYGATEQYAKWIAEELECDLVRAEDFKRKDFDKYDNIIYGGGLQDGGIKGFDLIKKSKLWIEGKKLVVFAVGINVDNPEARMQVRDLNLEKDWQRGMTVYYCMGAYDPAKISGVDKLVIKITLNILEGCRRTWTPAQERLYRDMTEGANYVDKKYIEPIIGEFK